jgi:hypothetical protein
MPSLNWKEAIVKQKVKRKLRQDKEPTARRMSMSSSYGPLQLNGMPVIYNIMPGPCQW